MTTSSDFGHFCQALAQVGLSEERKAVALLWYADHASEGQEQTASQLAEQLHASGLTGRVNVARLTRKLARTRDTVRGKARGTFRIALAHRPTLDEEYLSLLRRRHVTASDSIVPLEAVKGTRPYLERLVLQVNGSYDCAFYDACAVLCRRLVESLLIEAFDGAGQLAAIQSTGGNLAGLDQIIAKAMSRKYIRLAKTTPKNLEKIKEIGDTAAHDRYYTTEQQDIAEFRTGLRKVVSELMALAGISRKD